MQLHKSLPKVYSEVDDIHALHVQHHRDDLRHEHHHGHDAAQQVFLVLPLQKKEHL